MPGCRKVAGVKPATPLRRLEVMGLPFHFLRGPKAINAVRGRLFQTEAIVIIYCNGDQTARRDALVKLIVFAVRRSGSF